MKVLAALVHCNKCGYTNNAELPSGEKEPQIVYCSNCSNILFQVFLREEITDDNEND